MRGDQGTEALYRLLRDPDPRVVAAACRAAGALRNRAYVFPIIEHLPNPHVRGEAISALARFGPQICGELGDLLLDQETPVNVRRQVPRVLRLIPDQRSVDVLLNAIANQDLAIRAAVLKALNRLRETAPALNFENAFVTEQIYREARYYFELSAALAPFNGQDRRPRTATDLLVRTIEERLRAHAGAVVPFAGPALPAAGRSTRPTWRFRGAAPKKPPRPSSSWTARSTAT